MTVAFVTGTSPMLATSLRLSVANCVLGLSFILFVLFAMFKFACGLAQRLEIHSSPLSADALQ
ncbi:hypothetical protein CISIN_1g0371771mg, partial [Citrus sinensis]